MKNVVKIAILIALATNIKSQTIIQNGFDIYTQTYNQFTPDISSLLGTSTLYITNNYNFDVNSPNSVNPANSYNATNTVTATYYSEFKQYYNYSSINQYDSIYIKFKVKNLRRTGETSTRQYILESYLNSGNMQKQIYWNENFVDSVVTWYTFKYKTSNNIADTIKIRYVPTSTGSNLYQKSDVEISHLTVTGIKSSVGIIEYENDNKLKVYPNPNNGQFMVDYKFGNKVPIRIYDIQGNLVYDKETDQNMIKTELSSGIYMVRIENRTFRMVVLK